MRQQPTILQLQYCQLLHKAYIFLSIGDIPLYALKVADCPIEEDLSLCIIVALLVQDRGVMIADKHVVVVVFLIGAIGAVVAALGQNWITFMEEWSWVNSDSALERSPSLKAYWITRSFSEESERRYSRYSASGGDFDRRIFELRLF